MKIEHILALAVIFFISLFSGTVLGAATGNVDKVSQQYGLILTGQIDKMLNNFTDNATWTEAPAPFGGSFHGKTEIKKLLNNIFSSVNVTSLTTTGFFNSSFEANKVVVFGNLKATVKSTNKSFDSNWIEVWTFGNNGSIVAVENYYDAAKMTAIAEAFKK